MDAALDAQSKRRRQRAEREKRLEDLAVRVLVAVRPITVLPSAVPVTGAARRFYR